MGKKRKRGNSSPTYESIGWKIRLCLFFILFIPFLFIASAHANPQGGEVSAGSAAIQSSGNTTTINQSTDKAVINWQTFNINQGETTQFIQPSAAAIALNRVNASFGASKIMGNLFANGNVWIINPAGIMFGPSAQVNVAGLLATTANISDQDFMNGNYKFTQDPNYSNSAVVNQGTIHVADMGMVALVAPGVENSGVIQANMGRVTLAAGTNFTVDLYGDKLINFGVNSQATQKAVDADGRTLNDAVTNSGTIIADGGRVMMTAEAAKDVVDNVINMKGYIQANTIAQRGGEIILSGGSEGIVKVTGKISAVGKSIGLRGGRVKILGKKVGLFDQAIVDASGYAGGGEVLIGGNYKGQGPEPNAQYTYISSNANVYADAIQNGDGGKIIAWSDLSTQVYGSLYARGGSDSGNGGFVETSSGNYLEAMGSVDASALAGSEGQWLLDPRNVTIERRTSGGSFSGINPIIFTPTSNNATVDADQIENALTLGTSVTITTGTSGSQSGDITVTSSISKSGFTTPTLTLDAAGEIEINDNIRYTSGGLNLSLIASDGITQRAAITVSDLTINANASPVTLTNLTNHINGVISVTNTGSNDVFIINNGPVILGTSNVGGNFTVTSLGSMTQTGALTVGGITTVAAVLGDITLNNGTNDFNTLSILIGRNVSITDANALNLALSTITGDLIVNTSGTITQTGRLRVHTRGSTATFSSGSSDIILTNSNNDILTVMFNGNNISYNADDNVTLGTSTITGDLTVTADSFIEQSGALLVNGVNKTATFTTDNRNRIILTNPGNDFTNFAVTSADNVSVTDVNAINLAASTISGNFTVNANGAITQSGTLSVNGLNKLTTLSAGSGNNIDLTIPTNDFRNVEITSGNDVNIADINSIILGTSVVSGNLSVTTHGSITQNGTITANGVGKTLTLDAGNTGDITLNNFNNNFSGITISNAQDVNLRDKSDLTMGAVNSHSLFASVDGSLTTTGLIQTSGGNVRLATTGSGIITIGTDGIKTSLGGGALGGDIKITAANTANLIFSVIVNGILDTTSGTGGTLSVGGGVQLNASPNVGQGNITLQGNGTALVLGTLDIFTATTFSALSDIIINGVISTHGAGSNVTFIADSGNAGTGGVRFTSTGGVDATDGGANISDITVQGSDLYINPGVAIELQTGSFLKGGTISLLGNIGSSDIVVNGSVTSTGTGQAVTINPTGIGQIYLGANISTNAGAINLNSILQLTNDASLVTNGGVLTENNAIIGNGFALTIDVGSGTNLNLTNANNALSTLAITHANNVQVTNNDSEINLGTSTISGDFTLIANGDVTQSGTLLANGSGKTATFSAGTSNSINLIDSLNDFSSFVVTSANDVNVVDANGINLAGLTLAGSLSVATNGAITQSDTIFANGANETATFDAGASHNITLNNAANDFSNFSIASGNDVDVTDVNSLNFSDSIVSGDLTVNTTGDITQLRPISVSGAATFNAGAINNITLTEPTNDFTNVAIVSGNNVSLTDANNLNFNSSTISGNLIANTTGTITQSGILLVNGIGKTATFDAGPNNDITLINGANDFTNLAITSGKNVSVTDANTINLAASDISGDFTLNTSGAITQSGSLLIDDIGTIATFSAGATNNITLTDPANDFTTIAITSGFDVNIIDENALNLATSIIQDGFDITAAGAVTQSGGVTTPLLNIVATGGIVLTDANNHIDIFNATNSSSDDIVLRNNGSLNISGIIQSDIGNVDVINTGDVTILGTITTQGGNVDLKTLSPDSLVRTLTVNAAITTNGGAITINTANPSNSNSALIINDVLSTIGGTGQGTLFIGGGVVLNTSPSIGAGNIVLQGNGLDLTLSTNNYTIPTAFLVDRYIYITGAITSSANLGFLSDADNDGIGGVLVLSSGSINTSGDLTLEGSSLAGAVGALTTGAIEIQGGASISAGGAISLLGNVGNSDIFINGPITNANSITATPAGTGAIQLGVNSLATNGGNLNFNGPLILNQATTTLNSSATGNILFNGNVSGNTLNIVNADNIINVGTINLFSFVQSAGSGTTSFGNNLGIITSGTTSVTTNNVTGNVNVSALILNTNFANLTGLVNGASGSAAIASIQFLNSILPGTHFFDGIDVTADMTVTIAVTSPVSITPDFDVIFALLNPQLIFIPESNMFAYPDMSGRKYSQKYYRLTYLSAEDEILLDILGIGKNREICRKIETNIINCM